MTRTDPPVAAGRPRAPSSRREDDPFALRCRRLGPALMRDLALTEIQAAGLLGNLGHETGGFARLQEIAPTVPGSRGGWGLAQWTGPRRRAMEAWCRARGLDPASDEANEGYLRVELTTSEAPALAALRRAVTLPEATASFARLFERPGIVAPARRLAWARRALAAIRAASGPEAPPPAPGLTHAGRRPRSRRASHRSTPARRLR